MEFCAVMRMNASQPHTAIYMNLANIVASEETTHVSTQNVQKQVKVVVLEVRIVVTLRGVTVSRKGTRCGGFWDTAHKLFLDLGIDYMFGSVCEHLTNTTLTICSLLRGLLYFSKKLRK